MKRLIAFLLTFVILFSCCALTTSVSASAAEYDGYIGKILLVGDANLDGTINAADYAMIVACAQCNMKLGRLQERCADVNFDGVVDAFDAIEVDVYLAVNGEKRWW